MTEYAKGFDHGCDFIIEEIRKFAMQYKYDENSMPFLDLLVHLKMEKPSEPN